MTRDETDPSDPAARPALDAAFEPVAERLWRQAASASLPEGATLESLVARSLDGLSIAPLYAARSLDEQPHDGRTIASPAMQSEVGNRVVLVGRSIDALREHALTSLAGGADEIELPAQIDRSHGDELVADAFGRLFDGIHAEMIAVSLAAGADHDARIAALEAHWSGAARVDPASVRGAMNLDPIGHSARLGDRYDDFDADALAQEVFQRAERFPQVTSLTVDTVAHHDAGASAVTELAAAIATADRYRTALMQAGPEGERLAARIVFRIGVSPDYLATVVKVRALHRAWRHVLAAHAIDVAGARIVAETGARYLSRREPWNNHLRHVIGVAGAMAGGIDTLVVHPHDRIADESSGATASIAARVARNIKPILVEEGHLLAVADPLGGSYAIERLTEQLVGDAWTRLEAWQRAGGIETVYASGQLAETVRTDHLAAVAPMLAGERVMVGVNRFPGGDESVAIDSAAVERLAAPTASLPVRRLAEVFGQ